MSSWAKFAAKPGNLERRNKKRRARHNSEENSAKCREWYKANRRKHIDKARARYRVVGKKQQAERRAYWREMARRDDAARCERLAYGEFI